MRNTFDSAWKTGLAAAAAVGLSFAATSATAADLGGDCCADLEERVAELEATTARKGNRKVSLKITGYVAEQIVYWDDGRESNVYQTGLGPTQTTNVRFLGKAQFAPGWWAGYMIRLQNLQANPFNPNFNQNSDEGSNGLGTQMAYWFLQSKQLGKVAVGLNVQAAKSAAMFTDKSGTQLFSSYSNLGGFPRFFLVNDAGQQALRWGDISHCYTLGLPLGGDCNGVIQNGIRYDSPKIAGFWMSASWAEDDMWEVALRYAGKVQGFKLHFGMGYTQHNDEGTVANAGGAVLNKDTNFFQIGGYAEHLASGIFVHGSYGREDNSGTTLANNLVAPDSEHYHVKGGIRASLVPLGKTVFYGAYKAYLDQISPAALAAGVTDSEFSIYGGGIAQELDAAAMTLWLNYDHYEADVTGGNLGNLKDADFLGVGAVIHF